MPGLAIRLYLHRIEVIGDCLDTRLRSIGACAVAAAAGGGRTKRAIAVTILDIPVVRALQRVRIFDLIDDPGIRAPGGHHHVARWCQRVTIAVAEPDRVTGAEHDVV